MIPGLYSPKGTHDSIFLGNYANINIIDQLLRTPGVAQVNATGKRGYSSGQVMIALEEVYRQTIPADIGLGYIGMSFQEKRRGKAYLRQPSSVFHCSVSS